MKLLCKNLKINLRYATNIDIEQLKKKKVQIYKKKSCTILKLLKTTITIYNHSPCSMHVTGLASQQQLVDFFDFTLKSLCIKPIEGKVDNSMFSCKMNRDIDLKRILVSLPKQCPYYCVYKSTLFPALFLKVRQDFKFQGYPTILIFRTGSFIMLGGTNIAMLRKTSVFIKSLLCETAQ